MAAEVLENLRKAIIEGNSERAISFTKEAIGEGLPGVEIVQESLVLGINTVGKLFSSGEYYLPELIVCGKAMQAAVDLVEPRLADKGDSFRVGKFLIGTVKGDIHDIGKNIVIMMLKGNGWEVTDLGVDIAPERFCSAIKDGDYDIFGMSTLLTVTMPAAGETIEAIKEAGLRERVKIMIGGAPVTQEFSDKIGADEHAQDAWDAVTKARDLINRNG
ncbi:MAG: corrinoid protein [Deltaproteobacteria bacterium]|nr:corrinoid protein [Deltaproteobacteria bacterium]